MSRDLAMATWCLVMALPLGAEDHLLRDLDVRIETLPTVYDYTVDSGTGIRQEGEDRFRRAFGIVVGLRSAPTGRIWGVVYGAEAAGGRSWSDGVVLLTGEFRGSLGLGWRPWPSCLILAEGLLGVGLGRLHVDGRASTGPLLSSGVQAVLRWRLGDAWSLLGSAGWRTLDATCTGDGGTTTLRESGPCYAGGLAWDF